MLCPILLSLISTAVAGRVLQADPCLDTLPTNVPYHIVSQHSDLVLSPSANVIVQSFSSAGQSDNWVLLPGTVPSNYIIQAQGTTEKIIVKGGSPFFGGRIEKSASAFTDGRDEWCFKATDQAGVYQIENSKSGLVMDVAAFSMQDGGYIHQWAYGGGTNQKWTLDENVEAEASNIPDWPCETFSEEIDYNIVAKHSGMALTVEGGSSAPGANVNQSPLASNLYDDWSFVPTEGGFYHVIAKHSNYALAVEGDGGNGSNVSQQQPSASTYEDDWCFIATNGAYEIRNRKSTKSVDVSDYSQTAGSNVAVWTHWGGNNQLFFVQPVNNNAPTPAPVVEAPGAETWECAAFPQSTFYHFVVQHSGMALTVVGGSTEDGANVHQYPAAPALWDNWRFVPTDSGFYHVFAQHSGLAMAVEGDGGNGSNVIQQQASATTYEDDWCFVSAANGAYEIRNRKSGASIDVSDYSFTIGTNVAVWSHWGGDNQKFFVEEVNDPPAPSPGPGPTPAMMHSSWGPVVQTPLIAVAAANLPDGRIVFWSSFSRITFQADGGVQTYTGTYNPNSGSVTEELVQTNHDMFCPGTSSLGNGVLMISGGSNSEATTFYDYRTNAWTVGPKLKISRGYHSHTVLADGGVLTIGGSWSGAFGAKTGEIWNPSTNTWRIVPNLPSEPLQTNDNGGPYRSDNHYWLFLAPNGKVFHAGPSKLMHWIDTTGNGSITASINRGDDDDAMNGNAIMYDVGKILTIGGAPNYDTGSGTTRAYVIDINGNEATVRRVGNMYYKRTIHNSALLPSGEVVVVGGQTSVTLFSDQGSVYQAEIWNPVTETFKVLAPTMIPRPYHSVAILMKDGRVWAAGGGLCNGCNANHADFEILTPPYLFTSSGSPATRPSIQSVSSNSVTAGGTIVVTMDSAGTHTFALVRTSAVTHSVNTDLRRIPLAIASSSGAQFTLSVPSNTNVALTGIYYLFAMNSAGVPSVAEDIQIAL